MRRRRYALALLSVWMVGNLLGCSSTESEPTPEVIPASQAPNDTFEGGGAGGTNDQDNDGMPEATLSPEEKVEDEVGNDMDDVKEDIQDGMDDIKEGTKEAIDDAGDAVERGMDDIRNAVN